MADTVTNIKTWGCECLYSQDFDPTDAQAWDDHITSDPRLQQAAISKGLDMPPQGKCPACWLGLNSERTVCDRDLAAIVDLSQLSETTVADDATLAATQVPDLDINGQIQTVLTGEHYEMQVDPTTGALSSVLVPDYGTKMRLVNDVELAALKAQRDQELNRLNSMAA